VTRFGYAFCATGRLEPEIPEWAASSPYEYRLIWGARGIALHPGDNLLGRTHDATIWVDHTTVSRRHALVRLGEDRATIEDCGSRNGTFLDAHRIGEPVSLRDGDRILLGGALLVFRICRSAGATTAAGGERPAPASPPAADPDLLAGHSHV
jgi:predicted component of type VI protein secretion system